MAKQDYINTVSGMTQPEGLNSGAVENTVNPTLENTVIDIPDFSPEQRRSIGVGAARRSMADAPQTFNVDAYRQTTSGKAKSKYDQGNSIYMDMMYGSDHMRAANQSGWQVFGNGAFKLASTAVLTAADMVVGDIFGLGQGIYEGITDDEDKGFYTSFVDGFMNNEVSKTLSAARDSINENFVTYNSIRSQQRRDDDNIFNDALTGQFWSDDIMANVGFSVGIGLGMAAGKGVSLSVLRKSSKLGKLLKTASSNDDIIHGIAKEAVEKQGVASLKTAKQHILSGGDYGGNLRLPKEIIKTARQRNLINTTIDGHWSLAAASSESRTEALDTGKQLDLELIEYLDSPEVDQGFLRRAYADLTGFDSAVSDEEFIAQLEGLTPERIQELSVLKDSLKAEALNAGKRLNLKAQLGVYAGNIPVVGVANMIMYGKGLAASTGKISNYKGGNVRKLFGKPAYSGNSAYLLKTLPDGKVGIRKFVGNKGVQVAGRTLYKGGSEGVQEMTQGYISNVGARWSASNINEELLELTGYRFDNDHQIAGAGVVQSFTELLSKTFKDTFSESDIYLEGFIGALTGIAPRVSQGKIINVLSRREDAPWYKGLIEGGIVEAIEEAGIDINHAKKVMNELNPLLDRLANTEFISYTGAHLALSDEERASLEAGNRAEYKHTVAKKFVNDYLLMREAGLHEQYLDKLAGARDEALSIMHNHDKDAASLERYKEVASLMRDNLGEQAEDMMDVDLWDDYISSMQEGIRVSKEFIKNKDVITAIAGNQENALLDELAYQQTMLSIYQENNREIADDIYFLMNDRHSGGLPVLDNLNTLIVKDPALQTYLEEQGLIENIQRDNIQLLLDSVIGFYTRAIDAKILELQKAHLSEREGGQTISSEQTAKAEQEAEIPIEDILDGSAEVSTTKPNTKIAELEKEIKELEAKADIFFQGIPSSSFGNDLNTYIYNRNKIEQYLRKLGNVNLYAHIEKLKKVSDSQIQEAFNNDKKQTESREKVIKNKGDVHKSMVEELNRLRSEGSSHAEAVQSLLETYAGQLLNIDGNSTTNMVGNITEAEYAERLRKAVNYLQTYRSVVKIILKYRGDVELSPEMADQLDVYNNLLKIMNHRLVDSTYLGGDDVSDLSHFIENITPESLQGIVGEKAMVDAIMSAMSNSSLIKELYNALEIIRSKQNEVSIPLESLLFPEVPTEKSGETAQNENPAGNPTKKPTGKTPASTSISPAQHAQVKTVLDSIGYTQIKANEENLVGTIRSNVNAINRYFAGESTLPKNDNDRVLRHSLYTILKKNLTELEKYLINNPGDRIEVDTSIQKEIQEAISNIELYSKPFEAVKKELQDNLADRRIKFQRMDDMLQRIHASTESVEETMDGRRSLNYLISASSKLSEIIAAMEVLHSLQTELKEERIDNDVLIYRRDGYTDKLRKVNKLIESKKEKLRKAEEKQKEAQKGKANPETKKTPSKNPPAEGSTESKSAALGLPREYQEISETTYQIFIADDMLEGETGDSSTYGGVFQLDDNWAKGDRSNSLNQSMNDIYDYINRELHGLLRRGEIKKGAKLYVGYSRTLSLLSTDTKEGKYNNLALFVEVNGRYIPIGPIQGKTNTLGKDASKPTLDNGLFKKVVEQAKEYVRNKENSGGRVKDLIFTATPVGEFVGLSEIGQPVSDNNKYKIYSENNEGNVVEDFDIDASDSVVAIVVGGEDRSLLGVTGNLNQNMVSPNLRESVETRNTAGLVFMLKPSPVNTNEYDSSYVDIGTIKDVTDNLNTPEEQEAFADFLTEQFNNSLLEAIQMIREAEEGNKDKSRKLHVVPLSSTSLGNVLYLASSPHSTEISNSTSMPKYYMAVKMVNENLVLNVATRNSDTGQFGKIASTQIDISETAALEGVLLNEKVIVIPTKEKIKNFASLIIDQMQGVDLRFNITGNTSKDLLKKLANFGALTTNRRTISPKNAVPIYSIKAEMDASEGIPSSVPNEAFDSESLGHAVETATKTEVGQEQFSTKIIEKVNNWKSMGANKSILNQVKRSLVKGGMSYAEANQRINDTLAIGFSENKNIAKISEMMRDLAKCK